MSVCVVCVCVCVWCERVCVCVCVCVRECVCGRPVNLSCITEDRYQISPVTHTTHTHTHRERERNKETNTAFFVFAFFKKLLLLFIERDGTDIYNVTKDLYFQ